MEKQPVKLDMFSTYIQKVDLFICSSSFEKRCFSIANEIGKTFKECKKLIFFNENEYKEIVDNADQLASILFDNSEKHSLNSDKPIDNSIKINAVIDSILKDGNINNIVLDTTTFTHETLLVIFRLLHFKKDKYKSLIITYVGAKDYSVNENDQEKKWLSNGISSIRSVLGYPGVMSPARDNHLVVLFGFESDRTKALIESFQFDTISLGFGAKEKSIDISHQGINYERHCELMKYFQNAHKFEMSLIDPIETKNNIIAQIDKFPNHNTVIAPMNNKLSTIGAALVSIERSRVQLIYAKPVEYNVNGYSEARDDFYYYSIFN